MLLVNISAAIYAWRFTHFYASENNTGRRHNIISKTWKLFTGPKFYKMEEETLPPFPFTTNFLVNNAGDSIETWYGKNDSTKDCVIFFHGVTINKSYLIAEAARFHSWGYNVLLVDFRGHGRSGGFKTSFGVKETDEVKKAFDHARGLGHQRIILYGLSMGAIACMKATAEKLVSPSAIIADMPFDKLHNHLKNRARDLGFPSQPFAFLVTFWMGVENGYNGFTHDVTSYAKNIHCPVLLQWGDRDRYTSRTEIDNVYKSIAARSKRMVVYEGADHQSLLQYDPVKWSVEVHRYLNDTGLLPTRQHLHTPL